MKKQEEIKQIIEWWEDNLQLQLQLQKDMFFKELFKIIKKYRQNNIGFDYYGFMEELKKLKKEKNKLNQETISETILRLIGNPQCST